MSQNNRNGQPYEGVCDIQHTVHSDELFAIRQPKRNGQPDQGVCDIRHTVHSDELFAIREHNRNGSQIKVCAIYDIQFTRMYYLRLGNATETVNQIKICAI